MIDWLTGFHRRLESSFNEQDVFFQKVIDDHLNSGRTMQEHEDIVNVLLRMESDQTENSAIQITKDHI